MSDKPEVVDHAREAYSSPEPWYLQFVRPRSEEMEDYKAKEAARLNIARTPEYLLRRNQHR